MKIKKNIGKSKWVDYVDGIKFHIRPFPNSAGIFNRTTPEELADAMRMRFNYTLIDWMNLEDESGEFTFSEENKRYIFDWYDGVVGFVSEKVAEMSAEEEEEIENL
jgi:hypothetical protein